mmetsp:Transcript_17941/g.38511  ORF Transcript_17941/g.38511 Transcript_17941/m.38511 type:complete len:230 (-) Transcript_17941:165-854(-)
MQSSGFGSAPCCSTTLPAWKQTPYMRSTTSSNRLSGMPLNTKLRFRASQIASVMSWDFDQPATEKPRESPSKSSSSESLTSYTVLLSSFCAGPPTASFRIWSLTASEPAAARRSLTALVGASSFLSTGSGGTGFFTGVGCGRGGGGVFGLASAGGGGDGGGGAAGSTFPALKLLSTYILPASWGFATGCCLVWTPFVLSASATEVGGLSGVLEQHPIAMGSGQCHCLRN